MDSVSLTGDRQLRIEELTRLERTIDRGLAQFFEVGAALAAIRDGGLYRVAGYADFDTYCKEKRGWGRVRAQQLMNAAHVISVIRAEDMLAGTATPLGDDLEEHVTPVTSRRPLPQSERQTRPMAQLPDEEIVEVWDEAVETHGPDAPGYTVDFIVNKRKAGVDDRAYNRQEERHHTSLYGVPDETPGFRRYRLRGQCDKGMARFADAMKLIPPAEAVPVLDGEYRGKLKRQVREVKAWCAAVDAEMARQLPLVEGR